MAIERLRRSRVGQLADIPRVDPIGAREAARTGQALSQAMNRVSQFAFREARQQYEREAKREGAQLVEEMGAVPALQQIAEQGGPQDLIEETAYSVANKVAANEIETEARLTIAKLETDAELGKIPYSQYEEQLNDVLLGYPAALADLDSEIAAITKTKLDSVASVSLTRYSETYQKRMIEDAQGQAILGIDTRLKAVNAAATSDSEIRNELLEAEMINLESYLRDYDFSEEFISKTLLSARTEATKEQIIYDYRNLQTLQDKQNFLTELEENPPVELGEQDTRTLRRSLRAELSSDVTKRNGIVRDLSSDIKNNIVDVVSALGDPGDEAVYQLGVEVRKTGDAELMAEYDQAVELRRQSTSFQRMPPDILQQEINDMRAEGITTPFEAQIVETAEKMLSNMRSLADKDPITAATQAGIIAPTALDYSSPNAMAESMTGRIKDARVAANHFGVRVKFLSDDEAIRMSNQIESMNALEKADLAIGMNQMPAEVWEQLAEKDQGVFAMVSAIGDLRIGQAVFQGQMMTDVVQPSKAELMNVYQDTVGDVYTGKDREAVIAASKAYYAATASDKSVFDRDEFEVALQSVTGGISEVNGFKVQLPRGLEEERFELFVENFTPDLVDKFGGVKGASNEEAAEAIQDFEFRSIGNNMYVVMQAGAPLMRERPDPDTGEDRFIVVWDEDAQRMVESSLTGISTRAAVRRQR